MVNTLFSCYRTAIQSKKDIALAVFGPALEQLRQTIQKLRSAGASEHIPDLERQMQELLRSKTEAERRFDESLENLFSQERETLKRILDGLSS